LSYFPHDKVYCTFWDKRWQLSTFSRKNNDFNAQAFIFGDKSNLMALLTDLLDIKYPIIVAPMFLVSNVDMVVNALEAGVTAAFPALNYRSDAELRAAITEIRSKTKKPFGVNLIVNKSNPKYKDQLKTLVELKVDYIITSLGSPEETIRQCKPMGIKVFCDVVDAAYAKKVDELGADAVIAVNNQAGGHCGNISQKDLIDNIRAVTSLPIISAGGIGTYDQWQETLKQGAAGVSVGTIFLASKEAKISAEYQQALIDYGAKDIVLTTKLSGSHLTVINTPYVQKVGTKASFLEKLMLKNKTLKKYIKMLIMFRGMKSIEKATFDSTYKTVWCAGPAIEHINAIRPIKEIIQELVTPK
jgi:nitronate monooxygenase